jgi:hypothetical protein
MNAENQRSRLPWQCDSVGRVRADSGLQSGCALQQDETERLKVESWFSLLNARGMQECQGELR